MNRTSSPLIALVGLCFVAGCGGKAEPAASAAPVLKESRDGRFGSMCERHMLPRRGTDVAELTPLCTPPFVRVIARPEDFHGRVIALRGVLVIQGGVTLLYPSLGAFKAHDDVSAIEVRGELGSLQPPSPVVRSVVENVTAIGEFDALSSIGPGTAPFVGQLKLLHSPRVIKPPPSVCIQGPPLCDSMDTP